MKLVRKRWTLPLAATMAGTVLLGSLVALAATAAPPEPLVPASQEEWSWCEREHDGVPIATREQSWSVQAHPRLERMAAITDPIGLASISRTTAI